MTDSIICSLIFKKVVVLLLFVNIKTQLDKNNLRLRALIETHTLRERRTPALYAMHSSCPSVSSGLSAAPPRLPHEHRLRTDARRQCAARCPCGAFLGGAAARSATPARARGHPRA